MPRHDDVLPTTLGLIARADRDRGHARPLLLGDGKLESTVRYRGIEVDDALERGGQSDV